MQGRNRSFKIEPPLKNQVNQKQPFRDIWLPALAVMMTVVISVTAASYRVGEKIGRVEARLAAVEMFANQGDRWTAKDGLETRNRLFRLEEELRELPPDWFEKQHDETRQEVMALRTEVTELKQAVGSMLKFLDHSHGEIVKDAR